MGGLTALMLADRSPTSVVSFANIEGNLAPEDCFLSRQIVSHADDDPRVFLARFAQRLGGSPHHSSNLFAASLPHKVRADAVKPIFESMVDLSDNGGLLERFLSSWPRFPTARTSRVLEPTGDVVPDRRLRPPGPAMVGRVGSAVWTRPPRRGRPRRSTSPGWSTATGRR
jgi:hypothetical protein